MICWLSTLSASAFSTLGPVSIEHNWAIGAYGIQGMAGKTYLIAGVHSFVIPFQFNVAILAGVILTALLFPILSFGFSFKSPSANNINDFNKGFLRQ